MNKLCLLITLSLISGSLFAMGPAPSKKGSGTSDAPSTPGQATGQPGDIFKVSSHAECKKYRDQGYLFGTSSSTGAWCFKHLNCSPGYSSEANLMGEGKLTCLRTGTPFSKALIPEIQLFPFGGNHVPKWDGSNKLDKAPLGDRFFALIRFYWIRQVPNPDYDPIGYNLDNPEVNPQFLDEKQYLPNIGNIVTYKQNESLPYNTFMEKVKAGVSKDIPAHTKRGIKVYQMLDGRSSQNDFFTIALVLEINKDLMVPAQIKQNLDNTYAGSNLAYQEKYGIFDYTHLFAGTFSDSGTNTNYEISNNWDRSMGSNFVNEFEAWWWGDTKFKNRFKVLIPINGTREIKSQ